MRGRSSRQWWEEGGFGAGVSNISFSSLFVFWMNRLQGSPVFNGFWQRFASCSCWLVRNLIWWRNDSEGYRNRKRDGGECRGRRVWWRTAWVSSLRWMMLISHLDVCAHLWLSEHHRPPPAPLRTSGPPSGPWSSAATLRILPDPESPASSGCFNKFIRVKLTHWIKSDGGRAVALRGCSLIQLFEFGFCIC